jgi:hypothetical protein
MFSVGMYRDPNTGRARLAVYCTGSRVFYFPKRYGRRAARALCARLNSEV